MNIDSESGIEKNIIEKLKNDIIEGQSNSAARLLDGITDNVEQFGTVILNDLNKKFKSLYDSMALYSTLEQKNMRYLLENIHKHIDFAQRDILVALDFIKKHNILLETDYPVAINSMDHIHPRGTMADNTRCPRFVRKCESLFPIEKELKFLDLGCSGGGIVLDACLRGHVGIGLEGSNHSLINQRAEWRLLKNNLFTCDITKDFSLYDTDKTESVKFDIISAWEVLEHLPEESLPTFFQNIKKHLSDDGYLIASISLVDDADADGICCHCTVKSKEWWYAKIKQFGFTDNIELFDVRDFARGYWNIDVSLPWESKGRDECKEWLFYVVLSKSKNLT